MNTPLALSLCGVAIISAIPTGVSYRLQYNTTSLRDRLHRLGTHPVIIGLSICIIGGLSFRHLVSILLPLAIAGSIIAATAVHLGRRRRWRRRNAWQRTDTSNMLGIIIGELQAGAQLQQALSTASQQVTEPQLRHALSTTALGTHNLEHNMKTTPEIPSLALLFSGWRIAETTGMSLVGILCHIRDRLDHEERHEARVTAALGGAKITAIILAILPIFGILMGFALGVDTLAILIGNRIGNLLLICGIGAECAGLIWSNHIIEKATQ